MNNCLIRIPVFLCYLLPVTGLFAQKTAESAQQTALNHYNKGIELHLYGKPDSAMLELNKAAELFKLQHNTYYIAKTHNATGLVLSQVSMYDEALSFFYRSRKRFGNLHDTVQMVSVDINTGQLYNDMKRYEDAKTILYQASDLLENIRNISEKKQKQLRASLYNNIAISLQNIGKPDDALDFYKRSLTLKKGMNDWKGVSQTLNNIGSLYMDLGKSELTEQYLFESLGLKKELGYPGGIAHSYFNIGEYYSRSNNWQLSKLYFDSCLHILETIVVPDLQAMTYFNLSVILHKKGDSGKAFEYLMHYNDLSAKLSKNTSDQRLATLRVFHELESKEQTIRLSNQKITALETKMRYRKIMLILVVSGGALLLLLIVFLIRNARLKERFYQQNEKNLLDKQRIRELENTGLKQELELKNTELVNLSKRSLQKKEIVEQLQMEMENSLKNNIRDYIAIEQQLNNFARKMEASEKDWDNLRFKLEHVHPGFLSRLQQIAPSLTVTDIRHCAYIRIGLNTKEIGSLLNIHPDSVQKSRVRLKKKLCLDRETDLRTFILTI